MIKVNNISYAYNMEKTIISDFSYEFEDRKSYIIYGENGRGKTTLIKLILGLIKPNAGTIQKDKEVTIGYVPDYNGLYENLTLKDNIFFRLGLYNKKFDNVRENFEQWSKAYSLTQYMDVYVRELSLGTKKKAALLCTLLTSPQVLVLDEPTGGLDEKAKEELINILKKLQNEMMIITVTHDEYYIKSLDSTFIRI